jgi:hypothetical protein
MGGRDNKVKGRRKKGVRQKAAGGRKKGVRQKAAGGRKKAVCSERKAEN